MSSAASSATTSISHLPQQQQQHHQPSSTTVSILPGSFGQKLAVNHLSTSTSASSSNLRFCAVPDAASSTAGLSSDKKSTLAESKQQLRTSITKILTLLTPEDLASRSALVTTRLLSHPSYINAKFICLFLSMPTGEIQTREILKDALERGKKVFVPRILPTKKKAATTATAGDSSSSSSTGSTSSAPSSSSSVALSSPPVASNSSSSASTAPNRMQLLHVLNITDLASFTTNRWGIAEPSLTYPDSSELRQEASAPECDNDLTLIICPGVAFDSRCHRLGHGKGYYDSYIAQLRETREKRGCKVHLTTIAIGFDEQIVQEVPIGETDVRLDEVLTPSHHFKQQN